MRSVFGILALAALGTAPWVRLSAGEGELLEQRALPEGADNDTKEYLKKKAVMRDKIAQVRASERQKIDDRRRQLEDERKNKLEPLGTDKVTIDGVTSDVQEPNTIEGALGLPVVRDVYEVSPEDFKLYSHERWSLNANDFRFDEPQYVVGELTQGHTERWWGFTYSITNSTTKPRRISPAFVAVTDKGVFTQESGGFLPHRALADSLFRPVANSKDKRDAMLAADNVAPLEATHDLSSNPLKPAPEPLLTFEAGQTRWGVALWQRFNDEFRELKIVVHGLNNAHRYDQKQRRVMVLSFERSDDEFNVARSPLHYKGKEWQYLWMWDQDIAIPIPTDASAPQIKESTLTTPAGASRLLWSFPYTISNSTLTDQTIVVKESRFVLRKVGVDVGGQKVEVEVSVVDDGRSTIYKAQYLKEIGAANPPKDSNRFVPDAENAREPETRVYRIESRKIVDGKDTVNKVDGRAVFDINDIDWQDVRAQVEGQLSQKQDRKALSEQEWQKMIQDRKDLAAKNPGIFYDPRRLLTDDRLTLNDGRSFGGAVLVENADGVIFESAAEGRLEFAKGEVKSVERGEMTKVKEQVLAAVPGALKAAKDAKQVVASFRCEAGLSSGVYRVVRSYRQPGVIQDEWLKAWEELDK